VLEREVLIESNYANAARELVEQIGIPLELDTDGE
jgi:hypothetical protein